MNKFKSEFTDTFGHVLGIDEEYKEVEERILAPARVKLANAASMTNAAARNKLMKNLSLLIERHEFNVNSWNNEFRPRLMDKLNGLRKDFILASIEAFEIPTI